MNIAVGADKISNEARKAIGACGGHIETTLKPSIAMVVLPEGANITNENGGGEHMYIALDEEEKAILHFTRGWNTEDCTLDLCERKVTRIRINDDVELCIYEDDESVEIRYKDIVIPFNNDDAYKLHTSLESGLFSNVPYVEHWSL